MVSNNTNWEDDKDSYLENDVTSLRRINQAVTAKAASNEHSEEALKAILEQVKQREDAIVQWNLQVHEILGTIKAEKRAIDALKIQVKSMAATKKAKKDGPRKKRSCPSPVSDEEEGNTKESGNKNKTERKFPQNQLQRRTNTHWRTIQRRHGHKHRGRGGHSVHARVAGHGNTALLREEGKLEIIRTESAANNIQLRSCKSTREGIKLFPETAADFRRLRNLFDGKKVQYYTFSLKEEKQLKVVLRGMPKDIPVQEVENELIQRGFPVSSTTKMKRFKEELPLILVNAEKSSESRRNQKRSPRQRPNASAARSLGTSSSVVRPRLNA
ncbi:hypothetical protein Trydic_g6801 [Trypoxylus dichotomus]